MSLNIKLLATASGEFVVIFMLFALALFLPANTTAWLAGWIFLGMFFGFFLGIDVWLSRHNPGMLRERMRLGTSDQQGWDKLLFPLLQVLLFAWLILMSLDAARFHWSRV